MTYAFGARADVAPPPPGPTPIPATEPPVGPAANSNTNGTEKAFNFGVMYVAQWAYYLVSQNDSIIHNGSFENVTTTWYQPHFDNDRFEYNIIQHTFAGQVYYQWYRSRGYEMQEAFLWSFFSSLAFELTIETVTERPSFQDMYQTPVYGTILGAGLEKLSQTCHASGTALGHLCGYLTDPFTLIPASPKFAFVPDVFGGRYVANVKWEF